MGTHNICFLWKKKEKCLSKYLWSGAMGFSECKYYVYFSKDLMSSTVLTFAVHITSCKCL